MTGRLTTEHYPRRARRSGTRAWRFMALAGVLAFLACSSAVGAPPVKPSGNFPVRIDLPNGFVPERIESGRGTSFFVGSLSNGAIWRGDLRSGSGTVLAAGAPGLASAGIAYEARRDRIWVAGGGPQLVGRGDVRVYDASSGALRVVGCHQSPAST